MKIGESIYSGASIINGFTKNRYGCFQFNVSNGTGILEGVSVFQMILESSGISLLTLKNGYWETIWSTALKSDLEKQASFEPYVLNTNVSEYIKSLSAGKVHFFKTSSGTSGNPYTGGSCFYMVYIIDTSHNGIGLALNHSTTAYFMRISLGDVVYTKLSA